MEVGISIIGTPEGFQSSNAGITENIKIGRKVDLDNSVINILPGTDVLMVRREMEKGSFFTYIAYYQFAKEIKTSRTGSFYGSAIVFKDCVPKDSSSIEYHLKSLADYVKENCINTGENRFSKFLKDLDLDDKFSEYRDSLLKIAKPQSNLNLKSNEKCFFEIDRNIKNYDDFLYKVFQTNIFADYRVIYTSHYDSILDEVNKRKGLVSETLESLQEKRAQKNREKQLQEQNEINERDAYLLENAKKEKRDFEEFESAETLRDEDDFFNQTDTAGNVEFDYSDFETEDTGQPMVVSVDEASRDSNNKNSGKETGGIFNRWRKFREYIGGTTGATADASDADAKIDTSLLNRVVFVSIISLVVLLVVFLVLYLFWMLVTGISRTDPEGTVYYIAYKNKHKQKSNTDYDSYNIKETPELLSKEITNIVFREDRECAEKYGTEKIQQDIIFEIKRLNPIAPNNGLSKDKSTKIFLPTEYDCVKRAILNPKYKESFTDKLPADEIPSTPRPTAAPTISDSKTPRPINRDNPPDDDRTPSGQATASANKKATTKTSPKVTSSVNAANDAKTTPVTEATLATGNQKPQKTPVQVSPP